MLEYTGARVLQILSFLVLIAVLVIVHEMGHFIAAKFFHVRVLRVSFGFGPRLAGFRRGETEYILSAIPVGGYVRLLGEGRDEDISPAERTRAFTHKPIWQRVLVVLAGPLANLVCPAVLYFFHFYVGEGTALSSTVGTVFEGQPADQVLRPGDRVIAVDDVTVRFWDDLNRIVNVSPGRDLRLTLERVGEDKPITTIITPRSHERRDALGSSRQIGLIGIAPYFQLAQIGLINTDLEGSPALRAGLRTFDIIISVGGRPVTTWSDLERVLVANRGEPLLVGYLRPSRDAPGWASLSRLEPGSAQIFPTRIDGKAEAWPLAQGHQLRYDTGIRSGEMFVHDVEAGSPAAKAGLMPGDLITSLDGVALHHWVLLVEAMQERPERAYALGWRTPRGATRSAVIRLAPRADSHDAQGESRLFHFGAEPSRATRPVATVSIDSRAAWAARRALETESSAIRLMVRIFGLLLAGQLPATAIGGPIMIFQLVGVVAERGVGHFFAMLALLSLNLGLINLLPVPLLDGGHLVLLAVEGIRRRPLSALVRQRLTWVGMAVLGALMLLALRNDVLRYWFS